MERERERKLYIDRKREREDKNMHKLNALCAERRKEREIK